MAGRYFRRSSLKQVPSVLYLHVSSFQARRCEQIHSRVASVVLCTSVFFSGSVCARLAQRPFCFAAAVSLLVLHQKALYSDQGACVVAAMCLTTPSTHVSGSPGCSRAEYISTVALSYSQPPGWDDTPSTNVWPAIHLIVDLDWNVLLEWPASAYTACIASAA